MHNFYGFFERFFERFMEGPEGMGVNLLKNSIYSHIQGFSYPFLGESFFASSEKPCRATLSEQREWLVLRSWTKTRTGFRW